MMKYQINFKTKINMIATLYKAHHGMSDKKSLEARKKEVKYIIIDN